MGLLSSLIRRAIDLSNADESNPRLSLFVDGSNILPGSQWRKAIDDALESTNIFLPCITSNYCLSSECAHEFNHFERVLDTDSRGRACVPLFWQDIPDEVTAGLDTVGVRVPSDPTCRAFLAACGVPVAAPSANLSTRISPTSASHVYEDMNGRIPLIIDGGESNVGIESTVLDITGDAPVILRPGAVTAEMIAGVLGGEVKSHSGKVLAAAPAPGMKYKHYAPSCECVVAESISSAVQCYNEEKKKGCDPIILCRSRNAPLLGDCRFMALGEDDAQVCRNIYSALHKAEKIADFIICEDLGASGVAASVMNRVNKAAGGKRV